MTMSPCFTIQATISHLHLVLSSVRKGDPQSMTPAERAPLLEAYGSAYDQLVAALAQYQKAMWHFKSPADPWSIHEIVVHITDSEANSYVRARRFIAEPGESVMAYDENGWAQR